MKMNEYVVNFTLLLTYFIEEYGFLSGKSFIQAIEHHHV